MRTNLRTTAATFLAAALLAAATGTTASAKDLSPSEILQRMDQAISGYADQAMDVTMTIIDADGAIKSYDFGIQQKGLHMRMIRMLSGELKGMSTLVEGRDRIYVYLPGFKKVRRVAAHNLNQTFAGSDFTNDDMAATTWADEYDATLVSQDDASWTLLCRPKPGSKAQHPEAQVTVTKQGFYQQVAEYRDATGTPVRRLVGSDLKDFHGVARYSSVEMTDVRTGHRTILSIRDFRVNRGLADALFSTRQLEWGN